MTEQTVWQPVEDETIIRCDCGECSRSVYVNDGVIEIFDDTDGEELTAHLPDEYALCRRVPAPQGVSVPVEVREAVREWLWANRIDRDRKFYDAVQRWSDLVEGEE